ncbi:zf-HC2 domain-containing protein [Isoptericola sp. NPDC056578]|uniref:zf-HC2 domain-containing protein n=1 Tax=Isoptericola sp. NPDC056578 TaxID=3345870 RepID=UPI0036AE423A
MTAIHDGDAPARRGAVDDAIRKMRAAAAAHGRDDAPGAAGTADPAVLRTVLATLPHDDQRLLWDRHVLGRELPAIATELGMHARAVLRRLRQAEERLGAAFAAAHARACPPGCLDTRQSLHSYVRHRLSPPRRTVLEAHLFGCQGCMRAFIDVREAGWAVRDAGPLLLGGMAAGAAAPVVVGALGAGTTGLGAIAWSGPVGAALLAAWEWVRTLWLRLGQLGKAGMIGAGTVAGVAVAAVAVAVSGGGGGPVAAPPAPGPTSSAVAPAPAPGDAASPDAPPEPEPSATTPAEPTPSEDAPAPPATDAPTSNPTAPGTAPTTPPPVTQPGTTPSSPQPGDPETRPTSSPTPPGSSSPPPPSPSPSPTPTPTSSPSEEPTIPEEPDPELVVTTVTRSVRASWHGQRWYRVVAPSSATVVDVRADDDHVMVLRGDEVGVPQRRWGEPRSYTIEIDVEAPEDVDPVVSLERISDGADDEAAAPSATPSPSPSAG